MKRFLLIVGCCLAATAFTRRPAEAVEAELGIGSKAPSLDVEHWVQTGQGFFEPVEQFESGKVYVVEFWATWCGPCISSMPHLAELQQKYRGRGVQIISITDEPLEEVEAFLQRENAELAKTFGEITSAYCLTSDPDGSSHEDYMLAAGLQGIPAAFVVGKTGLIEWIGHPMEIDGPLESVVEGTWDREAFQRERQQEEEIQRIAQETAREVFRLVGEGQVDQGLKLLGDRIDSAKYKELASQLRDLRHQIRLMTGRLSEATLAHFRGQLDTARGNPMDVARFGYMIYGAIQQGSDPGKLVDESIEALEAEVDSAAKAQQPTLYVVLAQLQAAQGNQKAAMDSLNRGIQQAEGRQRDRLRQMLGELQAAGEPSGR